MSEYPDLTIYAVRDDTGQLEPVAVSIGGLSLPILRAALVADPNGRSTGTRALVGEITFKVGADSGLVEVDSADDVPDLAPLA